MIGGEIGTTQELFMKPVFGHPNIAFCSFSVTRKLLVHQSKGTISLVESINSSELLASEQGKIFTRHRASFGTRSPVLFRSRVSLPEETEGFESCSEK